MNLEQTTKKVTELFSGAAFSDTLTFDFGGDGKISIDGAKSPPAVSNDEIGAACTIKVSLDDFENILSGTLDPQMAFMTGKLSVEGNMGIAMNLASVLGR